MIEWDNEPLARTWFLQGWPVHWSQPHTKGRVRGTEKEERKKKNEKGRKWKKMEIAGCCGGGGGWWAAPTLAINV
jgi:hypothetical protein